MYRWPKARNSPPRAVWLLLLLSALAAACSGRGDAAPPPGPAGEAAPQPSATAAPATPATTAPTAHARLGTSAGIETTAADPAFTALPGAAAHYGRLRRSAYRIEIPAAWNGELVLWAHGFAGFGTRVEVSDPPFRELLIQQGFAWAASSYGENGYVPGIGADDTLDLKRLFEEQFGMPRRTYITGASMGGNVVALSLEHYGADYDGGLALCGAMGGEEQIDYLLAWALAAEWAAGVTPPAAVGPPQARALPRTLSLLGPVDNPTPAGELFRSLARHLSGGSRPFFLEGYAQHYAIVFGLQLADPERASLPSRAATNTATVYGVDPGLGTTSAAANAGIRRLAADPAARDALAHPDAVPTSGPISDPLLTLHNTGDVFVPISQEVSYRERVAAAGRSNLLVQRAIRAAGHCQFSPAEIERAWSDLVIWVREGRPPAGDDLAGPLADVGRAFTNPLREGDPGGR